MYRRGMSSADAPSSVVAMTTIPAPSGRLAVLTAYAIAANAIPVPFLPDRVLQRIRGAIVQQQHGALAPGEELLELQNLPPIAERGIREHAHFG